MFRYYNANPMLNNIEDCTIRSLSTAEGISWDKAYKILCNYARKKRLMLSSVKNIEDYLNENYDKVQIYPYQTVGDFVQSHKKGTYLITMDGHITVLKDGYVYDTFSPLNRIIWGVWKVK